MYLLDKYTRIINVHKENSTVYKKQKSHRDVYVLMFTVFF